MDIRIKNLSKSFGDKAVLQNFSGEIREGDITVYMAPSGAGKTTLLRILAGLETPERGTIEGMEGKKLSMVFQEDRLCANRNAVANIRLVCGKNISEARIVEELGNVGLGGSEYQPVRELSGGMKRRVALVRALLAAYDILILDEPFKGLDEENRKLVMNYTKESCKGKTVLLVTHDEYEAEFMGGHSIN